MHKPRELYEKRVSLTLAGFQVTELFLKDYIETSYEVMRGLLDGYIAFSQSRKDIENHSLERLIAIFKTINGNHELTKNLKSVVDRRNRIAHRSLLPLFGSNTSDAEYWNLIDEISPLEQEIDKCMIGIQRELSELKKRAGLANGGGERPDGRGLNSNVRPKK